MIHVCADEVLRSHVDQSSRVIVYECIVNGALAEKQHGLFLNHEFIVNNLASVTSLNGSTITRHTWAVSIHLGQVVWCELTVSGHDNLESCQQAQPTNSLSFEERSKSRINSPVPRIGYPNAITSHTIQLSLTKTNSLPIGYADRYWLINTRKSLDGMITTKQRWIIDPESTLVG